MPNAAKQWERYGREDPYYAVLSDDAFRRGKLNDVAVEHFSASGEDHVRRLEDCIPVRGRALDFGCGTGRVLIPLAQRCEHVTGVDVSPSMLAECRRACDSRGASNVTLADAIPSGPGRSTSPLAGSDRQRFSRRRALVAISPASRCGALERRS